MRRLAFLGLILAVTGCAELHLGTPKGQGQTYVIFFEPFSAALGEEAQGSIKAAAESAKDNPTGLVMIEPATPRPSARPLPTQFSPRAPRRRCCL